MTDSKIDKMVQEALKNIVVIIDTRENQVEHITRYFDSKNIKYLFQKLDFGDYSAILKPIPKLGINEETEFFRQIAIERKNSLEEISNNLAKERVRFENELTRSLGARFILMVEESQGYEKIINHRYGTDLSEKSFLATMFTFGHRYNIDINFIEKRYAGMFIYYQLFYYVREQLKAFFI
jgi:ERCC4-type nuclease